MQSPFWKLSGLDKKQRQDDLMCILDGCANVGISQVVIPLVDDGSIDNDEQKKILVEFLYEKESFINDRSIQIVFESDLKPDELKAFIGKFSPKNFGINYDIGNSAALGFDAEREFDAYGDRILNVHVKDRILKGTTVPLGEGNADFNKVFNRLAILGYRGNYILQTARANNNDHAGILSHYKSMVEKWMLNNES